MKSIGKDIKELKLANRSVLEKYEKSTRKVREMYEKSTRKVREYYVNICLSVLGKKDLSVLMRIV